MTTGVRPYRKRDLGVSQYENPAEYQRRYREANPNYDERNRALTRARGRAVWRLKELYPGVFQRLFEEELRRG